MLSHLHSALEWITSHLRLSSPKVQLSRSEEQKAMAIAMKLLNLIKSGKFTEALENGSPTIKRLVSAETLKKAYADLQKSQGPLVSFEPVGVKGFKTKTVAKVLVRFEHGELLAVVSIDTRGLIGGFRLKPTTDVPSLWKHPGYADPALFTEEDLTLEVDEVEVGATITVPRDGAAVAGVVFLAGSGPTDKDSTIGPNKPLKDLAWGLASRQIAVCRWDKPSSDDSDKISSDTMTLAKEYIPYASAAIKQLHKKLGSGDDKAVVPIFILGHSLGGTVAPMLAATEPSIAGLVLLSAGGAKMYDSALRQICYLASIKHDPPFATQELATAFRTQVDMIKSTDFNLRTPIEDLPFGAPASYWLSIKEYDQVETAAKLDIPITVLQPGKDYQVTVEDDLEKWKEGLVGGKKDVVFKVYEELNHLLITDGSDSQPTPEDYSVAGHVDEKVVVDVCAWLKQHTNAVLS
jgi:pimeloyl-ACP methyl ester carboxylesterase